MTANIRQIRTNRSGEPDRPRTVLDEPPRPRPARWFWMLVAVSMLIGFAAVYLRHDMIIALKPRPGAPQALSAAEVQVVDGDTIRLIGRQGDIQLLGFISPETTGARCDAERERGYIAMRRLRAIVERGKLELQPVSCACPANSDAGDACKRCGVLRANGWKSASG